MVTRIGLDFGTANTVVAVWDADELHGRPIELAGLDLLRPGATGITQRVIPSVIAYAPQTGQRLVGAAVTPAMFDDHTYAVFQSTKSVITQRVRDIARRVGATKIHRRQAATDLLSDIIAATLLAVDDDTEIVATAPVEAFDSYRDWIVREVAAQVGLSRVRVVDEATAAAVGYSTKLKLGDTFLVFDFGAGTLDISVARIIDSSKDPGGAGVRVVAKAGADLGGDSIDLIVAEHLADRLRLPANDARRRNLLFGQLLRTVETAKVALTQLPEHTVSVTCQESGTTYETVLGRDTFEALLASNGVTERVKRVVQSALVRAAGMGHDAGDISSVFMVGGASLIPAVQRIVHSYFPPGMVHLDRPLEAVAAGAAGIAGGRELHDHIQHNYLIRHVDRTTGQYRFECIVPAGIEYPTHEPVKTLTIRAIRHGQHSLGLAVYEQAHATYRESSSELELIFDENGGARVNRISEEQQQEHSMLWLNENNPTFLDADPPGVAGEDRFRLDFRIDAQKRLIVSAFDIGQHRWVLTDRPVVRLS
ncbi:Hsp70 family protein [Dactylosporangium siamense]|uniref:Molecular chaperone DnaK n=1 Tax=Dactylosporangium siamense TaxID=685454 RepID=A0A919PZW5_9ACTN|nr:Hsp70 family protein [Dactylosporangium siamense]GIG53129.1 molecular chaperone DnaK [Dactylosporangium siamense]